MRGSLRLILGTVVAAGISPAPAEAASVPIPAPEWNANLGILTGYNVLESSVGNKVNDISATGPGTLTSTTSNLGGSASATVTSGLTPLPFISFSATANPPSPNPASVPANASLGLLTLTYWGEVVGPDGPPVTIDAAISATATAGTSDALARATATITNSDGTPTQETVGAGLACSVVACSPSINVTTSFENAPNELFEVGLFVAGFTSANPEPEASSASAYIDPYFSLPESEANLYTLEFSPGVGNAPTTSVPEPSTWIMVFLGFLGFGVYGRRHQNRDKNLGAYAITAIAVRLRD